VGAENPTLPEICCVVLLHLLVDTGLQTYRVRMCMSCRTTGGGASPLTGFIYSGLQRSATAAPLLRPSTLLSLHRLCTEELQPDANPGNYRSTPVRIRLRHQPPHSSAPTATTPAAAPAPAADSSVVAFVPPPASQVPTLVEELCDQLNASLAAGMAPARLVAHAMHRVVHIHPFRDGNGRVGRALGYVMMCLCLRRDPG
jgi:Fic family protein